MNRGSIDKKLFNMHYVDPELSYWMNFNISISWIFEIFAVI